MPLRKTPRARAELAAPSGALTVFERRVLILCDGVRDAAALEHMVGADTRPALERLMREGYLEGAPIALAVAPPLPPARAPAPAPSATAAPPAAARHRRSLAASKMYLVDILQLQRNPEASSHAVEIHRCQDPGSLLAAMLQALDHVRAVASDSVSVRVVERLLEIAPEEFVPALERVRERWRVAAVEPAREAGSARAAP